MSLCGQANGLAVEDKQTSIDEVFNGIKRRGDHGRAELLLQRGHLNAGVETQAEKPGLFMMLSGR